MSGASEQQSKSTVAQYWASQQKNLQKTSMMKEGHEQSEEEDHSNHEREQAQAKYRKYYANQQCSVSRMENS